MDRLPPLNPLRAFEAAGRLKSIRRAAAELSVTPAAVSRQVQALEAHLGTRLFRRAPRAIALTGPGEQYLAAITQHLDGIREATLKLTGRAVRDVVKIRAYTTIAMKWLVPRLSAFQAANKGIEVRLSTSLEDVDFEREDVDGAIRLGDGHWPGFEVDRLIDNLMIPVCSPAFRRRAALKRKEDIVGQPLLHSLARPDDWLHWLKAAGMTTVDPYAGPKFASSVLAYEAAVSGQGISIAPKLFVTDDLKHKRLVQPFGPVLDRGHFTYYLVYPRNRLRNPGFRAFRDWLLKEARSETARKT
ncbi:MAG TPA: transcriptional regulator GcvA [Xanthobacteraceae bacterium]|jgi:LysR family glycine cleavage system transcriptional activator|nr:transcriptional regulator GcvA [Xanthobacteraceae bacterium]